MGRILDLVFDIIIFVVVEQVLARAIGKVFGGRTIRYSRFGSRPEEKKQPLRGEAVRDPVCGMFVSTELAQRLDWRGKALYFCSKECLEQYRKSTTA